MIQPRGYNYGIISSRTSGASQKRAFTRQGSGSRIRKPTRGNDDETNSSDVAPDNAGSPVNCVGHAADQGIEPSTERCRGSLPRKTGTHSMCLCGFVSMYVFNKQKSRKQRNNIEKDVELSSVDLAKRRNSADSEQLTRGLTRPRGYNNNIVSSRTSGVSKKKAYIRQELGAKWENNDDTRSRGSDKTFPGPGKIGKGKVRVSTTSRQKGKGKGKGKGKAPREVKGNNRSEGKQRITSQSLQNSQSTLASHPAHGGFCFGVGMQAVNCHA